MPFLAVAALLLFVFVLAIALIPLSLVQRYRVGTSRQLARGWLATINLLGLAVSVVLFVAGAALTTMWVPDALPYALMGLAGGCVLGVLGLWLTCWEPTPRALHYTPNRWLVLAITVVVTARLLYGFWRGWQAWRFSPVDTSWFDAAGIAGSLAAGAVVLGYYLAYWFGIRRRLRQHMRHMY